MFDGTDLSLAYGETPSYHQEDIGKQHIETPTYSQQETVDEMLKMQPQAPPPTNYPYHPQQRQPQPILRPSIETFRPFPEPTFWDKMGSKKGEIYKLVIFALVIVLALALDKLFFHYLKTYLEENVYTWTQELLLRSIYPIFILLLIWMIKSL